MEIDLIFSVGIKIDLFFVCGAKMTCFQSEDRLTWSLRVVEIDLDLCAGRK